jgi:hypothetical protein
MLDISVIEGKEDVVNYIFNITILSLIGLLSLLNILIYLLIRYLVEKSNIKEKYPRFRKIINIYMKTRLWFVIFELIIVFICLFVVFLSSFLLIKQMV